MRSEVKPSVYPRRELTVESQAALSGSFVAAFEPACCLLDNVPNGQIFLVPIPLAVAHLSKASRPLLPCLISSENGLRLPFASAMATPGGQAAWNSAGVTFGAKPLAMSTCAYVCWRPRVASLVFLVDPVHPGLVLFA